jgi:uncharacterized membrane protein
MHLRAWGFIALLWARALGDRMKESLLFVPGATVLCSWLLELGLSSFDRTLDEAALPASLRLSPEAAVALLSTIAGGVITTAGVVLSLLVLSLQLASQQFSPRVLRSYFRDPLGKLVVGLLVGVFAYCVLAIKSVPHAPGVPMPNLTIQAGIYLALLSVFALVAFLQRVGARTSVGRVLEQIARETHQRFGDLHKKRRSWLHEAPFPDVEALGEPFVVRSETDGWVQQVSASALLEGLPRGTVVQLDTRPGAFCAIGEPLATLWPAPRHETSIARLVRAAVVIGPSRTMQQDLDFGIRQIVDIALRALSPGVNDPATAVEAVHRLRSILQRMLVEPPAPRILKSARDCVLVRSCELDEADYIRHAFEPIRPFGTQTMVALVLVRSLAVLRTEAEQRRRTEAVRELQRQLHRLLDACAREKATAPDLAEIRAAARPALTESPETLRRPAAANT